MKKIIFVVLIVFAFVTVNRALASDKLTGHEYQLHFLTLTSFNSDNFISGIIKFSETEKTFTLTLYRKTNQSANTYDSCPYENSTINPNRFTGHTPPNIDGIGFTIIGITFGRNYLLGIFQFTMLTSPTVEELYLFLGDINY